MNSFNNLMSINFVEAIYAQFENELAHLNSQNKQRYFLFLTIGKKIEVKKKELKQLVALCLSIFF